MDKNLDNYAFFCAPCNFKTRNKADFVRHNNTQKHISRLDNKMCKMDNKKTPKNASAWTCYCGKSYKFQSGLSKHKKTHEYYENESENLNENIDMETCQIIDNIIENEDEDLDYKTMMFKLLDENKEFKNILIKQQKQMSEMIPRVENNTINNISNVHNVKNKLNINIFLNEQCKDALNINDFVKNININLNHIDFTKENGLAEGLSKAIIDNMNKLSLYERPLHCTDTKRETLYIKDNDVWGKDNDKAKIKEAIKAVSNKQFKSIKQWTDENPDFRDTDEKKDEFVKILATVSKDSKTVNDKVIKNLCNNSYLKDIMKNNE